MTKRIISVLLALVLVLALAMPAMAEEATGYSITISDEQTGATYAAYKVFGGTFMKEADKETGKEITYLGEIVWGDGVNSAADAFEGKSAEEWANALKNNTVSAKDFADKVGANLGTPIAQTAEAEDGVAVFSNLEPGYYFVKETTPSANNQTKSAFILEVVGQATATTKRSDVPEVEKKQSEADGTYDVGEEITFTLTAKLPTTNYDEYDEYYFQFKDTMTAGLTYVEGSWECTVDGFEFAQNGQVLTWTCNDTKDVPLAAGTEIVITYKAKLNDKAIQTEKETNTVVVIFSNDPENTGEGGSTGESTPDTEIVFTVNLDGNKIDKDTKKALAGAGFKLMNAEGKYYVLDATTKEVTWKTETEATEVTSSSTGEFNFTGLDAGKYTLIESTVPAGYNKMANIEFEIVKQVAADGTVTFATTGLASELEQGETNNLDYTVENSKGTTLPETGGIGTTIFYLVGGLMMAAAVVLLVAKKRTVNE